MQINRSEAREKAMTILYQVTLYEKNKITYDIKEVIKEQCPLQNDFIEEIVYGAISNSDEIVNLVNKYLKDWTIDRLGLTDQAILKIAVYEIIHTKTPNIVCINEAIELAKKYCDEKVSKLINGVLDKIYKDYE